MATLAGLSLSNARTLIHDFGTLGLRTICRKAKIPLPQFVAVRTAIDLLTEMEYDGRERYSRRMIERLMTQYDELGVEFESNDPNYLLHKMEELPIDILEDDAAKIPGGSARIALASEPSP